MSGNTEALPVAVVLRDVLMVCAGYLRQHDQRLLNDARATLAQQAAPPAAQSEPAGPGDMAVYQAMADRYAALAARGAQAEPVGDEREAFEKWAFMTLERRITSEYADPRTSAAWDAWQARAAQGQPEGGAA